MMQYNRHGLPEHEEAPREPIPFVRYISLGLGLVLLMLWLL